MNDILADIRNRWKTDQALYEGFACYVADCLHDLMVKNKLLTRVSYRSKDLLSLLKKAIRKGYSYEQIRDKAGVRVVVKFKEQVEIASSAIEGAFKVIFKEDKSEALAYDQVGYQAVHYEVTLPTSLLGEHVEYEGLICEVQVKTMCQDIWAEFCHSLAYKSDMDIPDSVRRQIYCLSALLEVADRQVSEVRREIKSLPAATTFAIINGLEKLLYEFVTVEYDRELTFEVVEYLLELIDPEGSNILNELVSFTNNNQAKLNYIFETYRDEPTRHLFLFQPESLLIFDLLEFKRHLLYEHWTKKFPAGELEGLAVVWGKPYNCE